MTRAVRPRLLLGDETGEIGGHPLPILLRFEGLPHRWTWTYQGRRVPEPGDWYLPDALSVARMRGEGDPASLIGWFRPEIIVKPDVAYEEVTAFRPKPVQPSRIP